MIKSQEDCPNTQEATNDMHGVPYGSLMYVMVATRLDIAYVVGVVSQFMANLSKAHRMQ